MRSEITNATAERIDAIWLADSCANTVTEIDDNRPVTVAN
jgi:hypothetical protein